MKNARIAVIAVLLLACAGQGARAQKHSFTFGVLWNAGARMNTSYSMMSKDIAKAFSLSQGIQLSNIYYSELERFHDDIAMRKLDFIYANTEDDFLMGIMYGYKPLATFSIFGKDRAAHCLYVRGDSGIEDLAALAGKRIVTYPHLTSYSLLRKLLNAAPEQTFSALFTGSDAYAMLDTLVSGNADALFLVETNIDFFKQVNPGPVKQIKKIACSEPMHFMPMMAAPEVPADMLDRFDAFYQDLFKNESLKKYRPFLQQVDLKVFRVTDKDYEPFMALYEYSLEQNWDKNHEAWLASGKSVD